MKEITVCFRMKVSFCQIIFAFTVVRFRVAFHFEMISMDTISTSCTFFAFVVVFGHINASSSFVVIPAHPVHTDICTEGTASSSPALTSP